MAEATVIFDDAALRAYTRSPGVQATMRQLAGRVVVGQKRRCPVAPVYPVSGATVPGGRRSAGDFPLRPSGYMRTSIHAFPEPDGSWVIGPTDPAAKYVINGTDPHEIRSHGPWPLRNRATGQVFGPVVQHPGTQAQDFVTPSLEDIAGSVTYVV
jgi:hypothetical protein